MILQMFDGKVIDVMWKIIVCFMMLADFNNNVVIGDVNNHVVLLYLHACPLVVSLSEEVYLWKI